jgi:hypothetical protein
MWSVWVNRHLCDCTNRCQGGSRQGRCRLGSARVALEFLHRAMKARRRSFSIGGPGWLAVNPQTESRKPTTWKSKAKPWFRGGRKNPPVKAPERECLKQNSTPGETGKDRLGFAEYCRDHKPERAALTSLVEIRPARVSDIDSIRGIDALADRRDAGSSALSAAILDESRLVVVA